MENTTNKPILIVVGGQYGSESKGLVAGHLAVERDVDICVRTGSINAGHTVYYKGKPYVNQLIPVGWVNLKTKLVLGAGVYIESELLAKEVKMINEAIGDGSDVRDRLLIDVRCGVHNESHHKTEQDMDLHGTMGSTGKGVAAAIVDKMMRQPEYKLFSQTQEATGYAMVDTVRMLNNAYKVGMLILLEGTQGALLDFHLGHYPYVTSRQTQAGAWLLEAGLPSNYKTEIYSVIRTYPIRVAGNSGPMGKREIRWSDLARSINTKLKHVGKEPLIDELVLFQFDEAELEVLDEAGLSGYGHPCDWSKELRKEHSKFLSEFPSMTLKRLSDEYTITELRKLFEITTVTKKLRRIAELDFDELDYSVIINNPNFLVVNFLNYEFPSCWGVKTVRDLMACSEWPDIINYLKEIELRTGAKIKYVNCSPDCIIPTI